MAGRRDWTRETLVAGVRSGDTRALARAIVDVLKDEPLRRRMGAAGLARVHERFTVERMVDETVSVYARVARTGHAVDIESPPVRG